MKLRNHPALNLFGVRNWPPTWVQVQPFKSLDGEIGILTESILNAGTPSRLFVRMKFEREEYMGCLFIGDLTFCRKLDNLLKNHTGRSIKEIGDLDLSFTL